MSADGTLPPGVTHADVSDPPPRPWLDDDSAEPEPERLRCRQCGGLWNEPKLSPDGVCPFCVLAMEE